MKPTPTQTQRQLVTDYVCRQCTSDQLRNWLSCRRADYLPAIGSTWDKTLLSYAAARDAACWQLNRPEPALWLLLDGLESGYQDLQVRPVCHQAQRHLANNLTYT